MVCGHEVRANNSSGHDLYHFQFNCRIMIYNVRCSCSRQLGSLHTAAFDFASRSPSQRLNSYLGPLAIMRLYRLPVTQPSVDGTVTVSKRTTEDTVPVDRSA